MADYFNPGSLDPYQGALPNQSMGFVSSPDQLLAQQQNRQMALQGYQQQLAQQQLASQQAQAQFQEQQAGAPGRMAGINAVNAAMQDPRFAQLRAQEIYNQMRGNIGEGAQKYLQAQQPGIQQFLGGAAATGNQGAYQLGIDELTNLGLRVPGIPQDVEGAQKYLEGVGQSYQYNPAMAGKADINNARLESQAQLQAERLANQRMLQEERLKNQLDRMAVPKTLQAAIVKAQSEGNTEEVNRLLGIAQQMPQFNPAVQGNIAQAKDPMFETKKALSDKMVAQFRQSGQEPPTGFVRVTPDGEYTYTRGAGGPSNPKNWKKTK